MTSTNFRRHSCLLFTISIILFCSSFAANSQAISPIKSSCKNISNDQQKLVREFILYNYRPLSRDIVVGQGPYVTALCNLIVSKCPDSLNASIHLKKELLDYERIADFAISVSTHDCKIMQKYFDYPTT